MSREKFSPMTGISKTTLVNYETGASSPTAEYLNKLLTMFPDINPSWLLTGEGELRREWVTVTKEIPNGFGRAKKLTFKIYPSFRQRLQKEMGGLDDRKPKWLAKESGVPIDTIIRFLLGEAIPTVDELIALSGALGVSEVWLAEGDNQKKSGSAVKEGDRSATDNIVSDTIKYVIGEVEDYFEKNYLHLPSNKKAELIWLLYEELSDNRIKKEELTVYVDRLLKLAI
ncbi:MAG: helix-turn-helix domain-containing protein [Desulfuromonadales bacterium]|nr:helix-turn-helix domain-containing protein [Desulfuromonadales bacterium]